MALSTSKDKKKHFKISIYSILLFLILILGILSYVLPQASFTGNKIVNGSGVVHTSISSLLMSPILGFKDSIDICIFVMVLGAFMAITSKTKTLENGINSLIKKLKDKETYLIPILMFLFSIGGTTFGMQEETIGFYALLSCTMFACGMDTLIASAIIILGCGVGIIGSTVNPFVIGASVDAIPKGISVDHSVIIAIGITLWIISYVIATLFVIRYAKKVKKDRGNTYLSMQEQEYMEKKYDNEENIKDGKLSLQQKITLIIFVLSFIMMIFGFIPWDKLGVDIFSSLKSDLLGKTLGNWYFLEASLWFLLSIICISLVNGFSEKDMIDTITMGISDMIGVILIISISRGAGVIMKETYLDNYIIYNISDLLKNMPAILFAPCNYLLYIFLSVLVPSSSALATLSMPVMAPLVQNLGFSVEANIMTLSASSGLVNLVSPMCGAMISGLTISCVNYSTWFKWVIKLVLILGLISIIILTLATLIF